MDFFSHKILSGKSLQVFELYDFVIFSFYVLITHLCYMAIQITVRCLFPFTSHYQLNSFYEPRDAW